MKQTVSRAYPINAEYLNLSNDATALIVSLLDEYGLKECRQDLLWLGEKLGKISKRRRFSYRYLHSVLNGSLQAGRPLIEALQRMTVVADGKHPYEAMASEQVIMSTSDIDGCHIEGDRHTCEKDNCLFEFVRTNRNRRYCYVCSPRR